MAEQSNQAKLTLTICFGTSCFIRGARELYTGLMDYVKTRGIDDVTDFKVSFCGERCGRGPVLTVNGQVLEQCTIDMAAAAIEQIL